MYMSLRSHYVAASKRLGLARLGTDAACMFLLELVGKQQRTLGLRRAKVGMMREAVEVSAKGGWVAWRWAGGGDCLFTLCLCPLCSHRILG